MYFVLHAKLNLLLVFLGPAEVPCPDEVAIPKAKPCALIDGSAIPFPPQDVAVGLCNPFLTRFLSMVSQLFMHAPNACSL